MPSEGRHMGMGYNIPMYLQTNQSCGVARVEYGIWQSVYSYFSKQNVHVMEQQCLFQIYCVGKE